MTVINTVHADRFQHLDASGVPVTGIAQGSYSTRVATLTSATGTVQATVTISIVEQSGGWYGYFWTPTAIGTWTEEIAYSAVTPARRWSGSVEVITAAQFDPVAFIGVQGLVLVPAGVAPSSVTSLTIRRGDTTVWTIPLAINLTGKTLWFSVKAAKPVAPGDDLDDASALINAYWIDGGASAVRNTAGVTIGTIVVTSLVDGIVVITLTKDYTTTLAETAKLWWEVQLKNADGTIVTWVVDGKLSISTDLIRRSTTP